MPTDDCRSRAGSGLGAARLKIDAIRRVIDIKLESAMRRKVASLEELNACMQQEQQARDRASTLSQQSRDFARHAMKLDNQTLVQYRAQLEQMRAEAAKAHDETGCLQARCRELQTRIDAQQREITRYMKKQFALGLGEKR